MNSLSIAQRCVTAVGTSNGVSARSQIRAAAFSAEPLFPYPGIIGLNGITNGNNAVVSGGEASNKVITGGNNKTTITGGVSIGPGGSYTGAGAPAITHLVNPITLGPVDPGTSNQSSLANCPGPTDRRLSGLQRRLPNHELPQQSLAPNLPVRPCHGPHVQPRARVR